MKTALETLIEQIEMHIIFADPSEVFLVKLKEDIEKTLTNYENRYKKKKK